MGPSGPAGRRFAVVLCAQVTQLMDGPRACEGKHPTSLPTSELWLPSGRLEIRPAWRPPRDGTNHTGEGA